MGILTTDETAVHLSSSVRSSVESQKQMLLQRIACLTAELGGGDLHPWGVPRLGLLPDSPLRDLMVEVFTDQYGYEPKVRAIHAGLECGLFSAKLPGLDCVSFGPDLKGDPHLPGENVHLLRAAGLGRCWWSCCAA